MAGYWTQRECYSNQHENQINPTLCVGSNRYYIQFTLLLTYVFNLDVLLGFGDSIIWEMLEVKTKKELYYDSNRIIIRISFYVSILDK